MSLDVRGREAGQAARRATVRDVDLSVGLEDLKRRHRRRVVTTRAATVAMLLALVTVVGVAVRSDPATTRPVDSPTGVTKCAATVCKGAGAYEVALPTSLTWNIPAGYEQHLSGTVVAVRATGAPGRSPLVVLEDVRGGDYRSQAREHVVAGDLAAWMQAAPELAVSDVQQTVLAGVPATRLTVRPSTGFLLFGTSAPIPAEDQLEATWFPAGGAFDIDGLLQRSWAYVATPEQATDVWLLDPPGGPVTAVMRLVSGDAATTAAQEALLASLHFRPRSSG